MTVRRSVRVTGVVQGVGFRPYVHALATSLHLGGEVGNDDLGVFVVVEGEAADVDAFLRRLPLELPPLAVVETIETSEEIPCGDRDFVVVESRATGAGTGVAQVPPDTAVCAACLREVHDHSDRRFRYPFTACTFCGPRYTIVTGVPYDRPFTTMAAFPLCARCQAEYDDPADRRFHAQPTACPDCGPRLAFRRRDDPAVSAYGDDALAEAIRTIRSGGIVAVKGVGGYHLACDAFRTPAVDELRRRKQRGDKPFAVMVADLATAETLADLDDGARAALASREAPIVLAPWRAAGDAEAELLRAVAPGAATVGVLLPYSPLHHLLLEPHPDVDGEPLRAVVLTSGNVSDEPLCIDAEEADGRLHDLVDAYLHHDRPIHVSCDDSVVRLVDGALQPVRRSRGYAPLPVRLPLEAPPTLAVGGELKAAVCLASGRRAWLSQHVGDVGNLETLTMLARTQETLGAIVHVRPEVVAADAHPAYLSRSWAARYAEQREVPLVLVQHHHAHLASLLAEHAVPPGERVLGVVLDGTGYGDDGTIWGGELLLGGYAGVQRVGHLRPVPLPGGDAAIRRPARTALAHLHEAGIAWEPDLPPVAAAQAGELTALGSMLRSGFGCTPTTSMGRLFDAVASLLGVRQDVRYEGQAAMELEALVGTGTVAAWSLPVRDRDGVLELDPRPVVAAAARAVRDGVPTAEAALAFHLGVADAITTAALALRAVHGISTVGLTGGVFQNACLTTACRGRLEAHGMRVLVHRLVPPNDGGLALGQAAVAAAGRDV